MYSNRSLARCSAGKFEAAIADAESCLKLDDKFMKGYYRLANAQAGMDLFDAAQATIRRGLTLDAENPELKKMLRHVKAKRDTARRQEKKPPKAVNNQVDDDTKKHMNELGEQINAAQRELQETHSRVRATLTF